MPKNIDLSRNRSKEDFESDLNSLVDVEENPWIDAILEVTYSKYPTFENWEDENVVFNKDVFYKFAWYNLPSDWIIDFEKLQGQFTSKIEEVRVKFNNLQIELESSDYYNEDPNKKKILKEAIEYNLKLLELAEEGFVFEMEKAGYKHWLSDSEVEDKIRRIEILETDIFGGKIIENQQESELCFEYMQSKMLEYRSISNEKKAERIDSKKATRLLKNNELIRLQWYFDKISRVISDKWYEIREIQETRKDKNSTSEFLELYWNNMISREVYVDMFQKCIDLLWLPQKVRITSVTGIYDGPDFLDIPDNEKYAELPLDRVMKLISHEIMWHYVNQSVHEESFWKVRGAWNVEKEEWLAKFLDTVVLGWDVTWIWAIVPNMSRILAWEILEPHEFEDFVDLYWEITEKKTAHNIWTILRHKRNYPLWYRWVQHKDVTYSRWLIKVVNFLKNGWWIDNLFKWKFSINDIKEWITGNQNFKLNTKDNPFNPVMVTDIMLFFMISKTSEEYEFTENWFSKYITEKYWDYLSQEDISEELLSKISSTDFRKVFSIISPILQSIESVSDETRASVENIISKAD